MSAGYVIPVDPADLANRLITPESDLDEDVEDSILGSLFAEGDYEARIEPLLDRIPKREADLIYLYFIKRKRQADIAAIFEVTQAAISYRLDRGLKRIKFLLAIPQVTEDEMREDLAEVFSPIDVDILVGMWETTCQSEVATRLGLTQGRVRHRFFKAVKSLELFAKQNKQLVPYNCIFSLIAKKNFNVLKEVRLPQWQGRGMAKCL
jgi:DNA-directed RNA polymerase specialized sigma24 family protein